MYITIRQTDIGPVIKGQHQADFGHGNSQSNTGPWAKWNWNGDTLKAVVDPLGMYPLFYTSADNFIALSNSIETLLRSGVDASFDDDAISAFLILGYFLGQETPFRAIKAFPVNGKLHWKGGQLSISGTHQPYTPTSNTGRRQAIDEYIQRFSHAVERSLPEDPSTCFFPLSGGRDSRQTLLELVRQGFRPAELLTQQLPPKRGNDDHSIAVSLANEIHMPIRTIPHTNDWLTDEEEKNKLFECLSDEHTWFLPLSRYANSIGFKSTFDGIGPGYLIKGKLGRYGWNKTQTKNEENRQFISQVHTEGLKRHKLFKSLLSKSISNRWSFDRGMERIERELKLYKHEETSILPFLFWNRTRREIALLMHKTLPNTKILTPYLCAEVFDFLWDLPYALFSDKKFHDDAISKLASPAQRVGYAREKPEPSASLLQARTAKSMALKRKYWKDNFLVSRKWLAPRLSRFLLDKNFSKSSDWFTRWVIWLYALEELQKGKK